MIKMELRKSINIMLIILLIVAGMFINFTGMYDDISPSINILSGEDVSELSEKSKKSLLKLSSEYQNSYIAWKFGISGYEIACILLASFAYSFTYLIDKKSGFLKNILLRTSKKKYFMNKVILNAIIGGLIVIIPVVVMFMVYLTIFDSNSLPVIKEVFPYGFLSELFPTNPKLYISFFTIVLFYIGAVYATFSMAIGICTNNIVSSTIIPTLFFHFGGILIETIGLGIISPRNIYYFNTNDGYSFFIAVLVTFIIFLSSLYIIYKESKVEDI